MGVPLLDGASVAFSPLVGVLADRTGRAAVVVEGAVLLLASLVLSARSRGLVSATDIARMKPSAYLINTARGPIVDEAALVKALQDGKIAGAGLDTFAQEPLPADHPLRRLDNVVLTPHLGYVTEQNYRRYYAEMIECIAAWLDGKPVRVMT